MTSSTLNISQAEHLIPRLVLYPAPLYKHVTFLLRNNEKYSKCVTKVSGIAGEVSPLLKD